MSMPENISIDWSADNTKLIITVDVTKDEGMSSSGKSTIVASTHGAADVGKGLQLGLNLYKPVKK